MSFFDAYVSDYLLIPGGIFLGNVLTVTAAVAMKADLVRYFRLTAVSDPLPSAPSWRTSSRRSR